MSRTSPVSCLVVALGLALPAPAQEGRKEPAQTGPAVERLIYAVHTGNAKDLANALGLHFKAETAFQAVPDVGSNSLLLSGPRPVLEEAVKALRQLDRPVRTIDVEVFLLEAKTDAKETKGLDRADLSGPSRDVTAKIHDLQRRGVFVGVKRVHLAALEGQQAQVTISENKPFVTGVGAGPRGGGVSRNITFRNVGTVVRVKPEVGGDSALTLDLRVEDSRMQTPEDGVALGTDEKGGSVHAPEFVTLNLESRLRVRLGHAVLAKGTRSSSKTGEVRVLVVVVASGEQARPPEDK